jgi:choline monooxygenase
MTWELEDILGPAALEYFRERGAVAHGLPPAAYTHEEFLALENARLFRRFWTFVGFAHEMERAGDVVPVTVAGKPVLLVRNEDGDITAFHNVCRHRCAILVDEPTNVGRFVRCPYHTWAYNLNGELRSTPHFGGPNRHVPDGFDPAQHGLKPVRSVTWHDWVFVDLSGEAPDFDDYVAPLAERLSDLDLDAATPIVTIDFCEVLTNWKFLMENFIEPYHVQFVHSDTTKQPLTDHYTVIDRHCLGSAVDITSGNGDHDQADTLAVTSRYLTLFPNFVLGRYLPDQLGVHLNIPIAAGRTRQRRAIYLTGGESASPDEVEALRDLWYRVHKEDHAITERLQKGRVSEVAADGGLLSPHWEAPVRKFQELVVDALQ